MSNQEQFIRQDVVAQQNFSVQGNTFLGNDPGDTVTVVGELEIGGTTVKPVTSADYGPGPLTNEIIFSFDGGLYDAATCTVTVADDANADVYAATFTLAHNGSNAILSSAYGVADVWDGTNPTFNANYNAGIVELRMDIADTVSVAVSVDAKLFATQVSKFITILSQPLNDTVVEGDTDATFSVAVSSNDEGTLSFQWEVDDGSGFVTISDDATYSGTSTNTLTVTTVDTSLDTYQYRCVVSSDGGAADVTSDSAILTVNTATVTIDTNPVNTTVDSGDPVQFTVVASTNETQSSLTYSWEEDDGSGFTALSDGGIYSGTDTDTLDIDDSTGLDTFEYRCVVSTDSAIAPTAASDAAVLTVNL